jgi:hypothetical protein
MAMPFTNPHFVDSLKESGYQPVNLVNGLLDQAAFQRLIQLECGDSRSFSVDAARLWNPSGIALKFGCTYHLDLKKLDQLMEGPGEATQQGGEVGDRRDRKAPNAERCTHHPLRLDLPYLRASFPSSSHP